MNKINVYGGLWDGDDHKRIAESKGIDATVVYSQFFSRAKLKNDMKETQRLSTGSSHYYVFNTKVKALSNPKVRKGYRCCNGRRNKERIRICSRIHQY